MKQSRFLTIFLSLFTALFIVSASIAVPILCRSFYYLHIDFFELESKTELSREQIITAYDEMLDFCIGASREFSTGVLEWTEEGMAHFADVKVLFIIDLVVFAVTSVVLLLWLLTKKKIKICPYRFFNHGPALWGSVSLILIFCVIGGIVAIDFGQAFRVFHNIFFPGKSNWILDYDTDQIIRILPEEFFRNCAILVFVIIILLCITFIAIDLWREKSNKYLQKKGVA